MFEAISRLFRKKQDDAAHVGKAASTYWNDWSKGVEEEQPRWVDWGDHPIFLTLIYKELFGSAEQTLLDYLESRHSSFSSKKALSLCSGNGDFERLLIDRGIFGSITGLDIADFRVKQARENHASAGERLHFSVGDINEGDYGHNAYDIVFAKAALHHISSLEKSFKGMVKCLREGGHLVTVDFFGPSRFQWNSLQLEIADQLMQEIPENLRTTRNGQLKTSAWRPTVEEMIATDPSEAARSAELMDFINENFVVLEEHDIGGTIFNLIFTQDILHNFEPGNAGHTKVIEKVFYEERYLINEKRLPADFKFIIARKKVNPFLLN